VARVELRQEDGIAEETLLHSRRLRLGSGTQDVPMPPQRASYEYQGQQIAVRLALRLTDDKGKLLAESRLRDGESALLTTRPKLGECPEALMNPKDEYSLLANLKALPAAVGLSVGALGLLLYVLAGLNLLVGAHDQFVAEEPLTEVQRLNLTLQGKTEELQRVRVAPYVYRKGRRRLPLTDAFLNSMYLALFASLILRRYLSRYGDFHLFLFLPPLRPG